MISPLKSLVGGLQITVLHGGVGHRIPLAAAYGGTLIEIPERVLGKYQSISGGYVFKHHNFWYAQSAFETIGLCKSPETFEMTNA